MNRISIAAAALVAAFSTAVFAAAPPSVGFKDVVDGLGAAGISDVPVVFAKSQGGSATAYLFYNFEVTGITQQPLNAWTPLFISGTYTSSGSLSGSDSGYYSAGVSISGGSSLGHEYVCSNTDQSGCGAFSIVDEPFQFPVFMVTDGKAFGYIYMSASALNEHPDGFAFATVDPTVALSAAFLADNPGAQISGYGVVTPGSVSTLPAVPEPATWLMMVTGFGLVATSLRGRRNKTRAA